MHSQLARQTAMDSALCSLMLDIKAVRGGADKKVERLRAVLREDESRALTHFAEVGAEVADSKALKFRLGLTCVSYYLAIIKSPSVQPKLLTEVPGSMYRTRKATTGCKDLPDLRPQVAICMDE